MRWSAFTGAKSANVTDAMGDGFLIRAFRPEETEAVVALWSRCDLLHPYNDPYKDIARKLRVRPDLFLVGELDGEIVATTMAGYEGHRGWLNLVGVDPRFQGRDFGRLMIGEAERLLRLEGCAKINLMVRDGNERVIAFYEKLGYESFRATPMGKRLDG